MSLRSPLGRALGHGAAKEGVVGHWWITRVTSVALVPLTLWFLFSLLGLPALDHLTVRSWIGEGWNPVFLILLLITVVWHSQLGVQVFFEDYVHGKALKVTTLLASNFVHLVAGAAGVYAVLKIAFTGL